MTEFLRRGAPGMKSVKDMPVLQDGPPPGGFPSIRYARRVPSTGPAGTTLFGVGALIMAYGFYQVGQGNLERRANRQEKAEARAALVPFLQADEDRRWIQAHKAWVESEKTIMRDVEGFEPGAGVYKTRWMPPAPKVGTWGNA